MKRKSQITIGQRAVEELYRMFPNEKVAAIARRVGCNKKSLLSWSNGFAPSALFLARIATLGGDVHYILTGRKTIPTPELDFLAELEEEYT